MMDGVAPMGWATYLEGHLPTDASYLCLEARFSTDARVDYVLA